jgi:hypothetical protein
MQVIARKLTTIKRVLATQGSAGIASVVTAHARSAFHRRVRVPARIVARAPAALAFRAAHPRPSLVLAYFGGIGDDLLLTTVLRELRRRAYRGTWVVSRHPELFAHNPDPDVVVPWAGEFEPWLRAFGWNYVRPRYTRYLEEEDRDIPPRQHILAVMCEQVGIVGPVALRPYLTLTDAERDGGARVRRQVVIQSAGVSKVQAMRTKQWYPERFQQVVDLLRDRYDFVQVGVPSDPPLRGALDLRGQTTVRETAALLSQSLTFVSQVGLLMHLGRAVDRRGVIVYGGRETPAQSGYSANENLYAPVPCSPCWRQRTCPYDMRCMREISAEDVAAAVERAVARRAEAVAVDSAVIAPDPAELRRGPDGQPYRTVHDLTPFAGPGRPRDIEVKLPVSDDRPPAAPRRHPGPRLTDLGADEPRA